MTPDCELLRRYADDADEAAFAEVVRRHVDLVYSAALRMTNGDTHLSQDAAQNVFTLLARRAGSLSRHPRIVGWIYTTTRMSARNLTRAERRRTLREQEAYAMQDTVTAPEIQWESLRPVLDEAVCQLNATDREAVLLRFFQNKSHREVGDALGVEEDAARKRVDRALGKLRNYFARQGVTVTTALLAAVITTNSAQAAPADVAGIVTDASLAKTGGVVAESIFVKILLMSTKTKVLLAVAVIVAIFSLFTVKWPQTQSSAGDKVLAPTTAPTVVALPQSPPAVTSNAAGTISPNPPNVVKNSAVSVNLPGAPKASSHIRFAREPANGTAAVMAAMEVYKADPQTYLTGKGKPISRPELADLSSLKVAPFLDLYDISAVDIANGRGLEAAQFKGFFYEVYAPTDILLADMVKNNGYVPPENMPSQLPIAGVVAQEDNSGKANGATVDTASLLDLVSPLEKLEGLEQVQNGSYEMRRLLVRIIGGNGAGGTVERNMVAVFWLKSNSGGTDLIYPFQANSLPAPLSQYQLYTVDEFLKIIRPIAQQQLAKQAAKQAAK